MAAVTWLVLTVSLVFITTVTSGLDTCENHKQFMCRQGKKCIPKQWKCDGEKDCADGTDEVNCPEKRCSKDEFMCNSTRKCIPVRWRCDNEPDCPDRSDEQDCSEKGCSKDEFMCNSTRKCIPVRWRCDSEADCPDRSDEQDCNGSCDADRFTCESSGKCIPMKWQCDGDIDCSDESDERNCNIKRKGKCTEKEFTCANGLCIPKTWKCDGDEDCTDRSDELICNCTNKSFRCDYWTCIDISERCDGKKQCANGADEKKCWQEIETKLLIVSFAQDSSPFLYTTVYINGTYTSKNWQTPGHKFAVDYDFKSKYLFWISKGKLYRSNIPSSNPELSEEELENVTAILSFDTYRIDGIAVDWINKKIYMAELGSSHKAISVTDYNGNIKKDLISTDLQKPRSIRVDPDTGLMYWTDVGTEAKIERAAMDGQQRTTLVSEGLLAPNSVVIDKHEDRLYWIDAGTNKMESVDMNGNNRKVFATNILTGFELAITKFSVYGTFSGYSGHKVYRINKDKGTKSVINPAGSSTPLDVIVFGPQEEAQRVCGMMIDNCRHLCLPTTNKQYSCHCENGTQGCIVSGDIDGLTTTEAVQTTTEASSTTTTTIIPATVETTERVLTTTSETTSSESTPITATGVKSTTIIPGK